MDIPVMITVGTFNLLFLICGYVFGRTAGQSPKEVIGFVKSMLPVHKDEEAYVPEEQEEV